MPMKIERDMSLLEVYNRAHAMYLQLHLTNIGGECEAASLEAVKKHVLENDPARKQMAAALQEAMRHFRFWAKSKGNDGMISSEETLNYHAQECEIALRLYLESLKA